MRVFVAGGTGRDLPRSGRHVVNTWTLDILDGQIQAIRTVLNPDKLRHLGPVANAWVVLRLRALNRKDTRDRPRGRSHHDGQA